MRAPRSSFVLASLAAALALSACGDGGKAKEKADTVQPVAAIASAPSGPLTPQLRAGAGKYYFDFVKEAGLQRYAAENLGLDPQSAARFSRNMDVQGAGTVVSANGVEAIVFTGCVEVNCGGGAGPLSVIAIDTSSGDTFVGVKDSDGEAILKSLPRIQMLLTETSPTNAWTNPSRN